MTDTNRPPLSPAAQAVLDATEDDCIHPVDRHRIAAAALRAASTSLTNAKSCDRLRALAAELEGNHD